MEIVSVAELKMYGEYFSLDWEGDPVYIYEFETEDGEGTRVRNIIFPTDRPNYVFEVVERRSTVGEKVQLEMLKLSEEAREDLVRATIDPEDFSFKL